MQFQLRPLVVLLALVSLSCWLGSVRGAGLPVDDDDDDVEDQIEQPPENDDLGLEELDKVDDLKGLDIDDDFDYRDDIQGEDDDEDGDDEEEEEEEEEDDTPVSFDLDYVVKRPTPEPACKDDDREEVMGQAFKCKEEHEKQEAEEVDLKPYEKYPGYSKWERRPLFVIIIGGLRWDYLTESKWDMTGKTVGKMKAFNWIKKHGTTMSQVIPVFPPYDLPTWTSLATGLYPAQTGVTGDYMYNLRSRKLFNRGDSLDGWWVDGEPIWSVAAKNNRRVSVLNWHDCNLPGNSIERPVDCKPFSTKAPMPTKQKLIQLFNQAFTKIHSGQYDLSIVYTDAVKKAALTYGPNSQQVMNTLADLDDVLQGRLSDIKNKKERANLKLNILLLSDYGLNGRENTTSLVLDDYLDFDHVQYIIQRGGSTVLVPYALKAGDILSGVGDKKGVSSMLGVDAYVRDVNLEVPPLEYPTIPDELNYGDHTWTQDILLVAKPGFEIEIRDLDSDKLLPPVKGGVESLGTSGYQPNPPAPHIVPGRDKHKSKELRAREKVEANLYTTFAHMMKTIGFAWGPDFKPGYVSDPIEIVDLYQIMAFLLQIDPNHHDGDWDRVKSMLVMSSGEQALPTIFTVLLSTVLLRFL